MSGSIKPAIPVVRWRRAQPIVVGEGIEIAPATRRGRVCVPESWLDLHDRWKFSGYHTDCG